MQPIQLTRIAHVLPYVEVLKEHGVRYHGYFERWSLPSDLEIRPDRYVPEIPLLACLLDIERREAINDLGFLALQHWTPQYLRPDVLRQVRRWPTLRARLSQFAAICRIEHSDLELRILPEGDYTRLVCEPDRQVCRGEQFSAWLQIGMMLSLVRDAAGENWQPSEITMRADYAPSRQAISAFEDSPLLVRHEHNSILVQSRMLGTVITDEDLPRHNGAATKTPELLAAMESGDTAARLKLALPSYFGDGYPAIRVAADIAGTSIRSLQRTLADVGTSYSDIVKQIRFERATQMLSETGTKVIDVALSLGYEDASHFARAFRRTAGISPRDYRRQQVVHQNCN